MQRTINEDGSVINENFIAGTSFPEQFLYRSLLQIFPETINRYKDSTNNYEYDIVVLRLNLFMEYQGVYWHSSEDKQDRDEIKRNYILKNGHTFIEIVEDFSIEGCKLEVRGKHIKYRINLNTSSIKQKSNRLVNIVESICDLYSIKGTSRIDYTRSMYEAMLFSNKYMYNVDSTEGLQKTKVIDEQLRDLSQEINKSLEFTDRNEINHLNSCNNMSDAFQLTKQTLNIENIMQYDFKFGEMTEEQRMQLVLKNIQEERELLKKESRSLSEIRDSIKEFYFKQRAESINQQNKEEELKIRAKQLEKEVSDRVNEKIAELSDREQKVIDNEEFIKCQRKELKHQELELKKLRYEIKHLSIREKDKLNEISQLDKEIQNKQEILEVVNIKEDIQMLRDKKTEISKSIEKKYKKMTKRLEYENNQRREQLEEEMKGQQAELDNLRVELDQREKRLKLLKEQVDKANEILRQKKLDKVRQKFSLMIANC